MEQLRNISFPLGIGALSKISDCSAETIRYYEHQGLLSEAGRTAGGHRKYNREHFKMLMFLLRAKHLGFSQKDVRALVEMADSDRTNCDNVQKLADRQLHEVQNKIAHLKKLEKSLQDLVTNCESEGAQADCPMIDSLLDDF